MGVLRIARPFAVAFAKPLGLGRLGPIAAAAETVILAVMAGQSNMVGRNAPDGVDTDLADVFQYVGDAGQGDYRTLSSDITPLDHPDAFDRVGPGIEILKAIRAANPAAKIVAVPTAVGSSGILNGGWLSNATAGAGGTRFEFMLTQAAQARTAALAAYPGATIQWQFYWVQGEQDASEGRAYADYKAALTDVISRTRSRLTGAANAPWVMGSMVPEKWTPDAPAGYVASYVPINLVHVDLSVELTNLFYARGPEDPSQLNDNLHYQPASAARIFGQRMGAVLTDTVGPTITTTAAQGSVLDTKLAIPLAHNDPTGHATFHITGGSGAVQFELSDRYIAPKLRWVGDGTGPAAGAYAVELRARDGAGNYGPVKTFTVTVEAAAVVPVTATFREHTNIGSTGPVATFAGRTIRKGLNLFVLKMDGGNKDATMTMAVGGNAGVKLFGATVGQVGNETYQIWGFVSVIETVADVVWNWGANARNNVTLVHVSMTGTQNAITQSDFFPLATGVAPPFVTGELTVPDGGIAVSFGDFSAVPTITGASKIGEAAGGTNVVATKQASGVISYSIPNATGARRLTTIVLPKAS